MRSEGIRIGIYYSLSDWHHADYPAWRDDDRPYVFGASPPMPTDQQWNRYLEFMSGQLRELLTNYGPVDLVWFDGGWERPVDRWRGAELVEMMRSLQPNLLINDRLIGFGDYTTPEQFIPPTPPAGRWETCMTMNETWAYNPSDTRYKSARQLVHALCEVTSRGGNFLLNVSPTGTGALPPEQSERLAVITAWMQKYGEAVTGTRPGLEPWQFYGPSTRKGDRVYLHLLMRPYESVTVRGVPVRRVQRVTEVASGTELRFVPRTTVLDHFNADPFGEIRILVPEDMLDDNATVLALDITPASG
jgi:alpha-L-fucosidase